MKRSTFLQFASPSIVVMTLLMVIPLGMAIWLGMNFITYNNINDAAVCRFEKLYRCVGRSPFLAIVPLYGIVHGDCHTDPVIHRLYHRPDSRPGLQVRQGHLSFGLPASLYHRAGCRHVDVQAIIRAFGVVYLVVPDHFGYEVSLTTRPLSKPLYFFTAFGHRRPLPW